MSQRLTLRRGNDQKVTLSGLRGVETDVYLNSATVKATLFDSRGTPIPVFTDVPMTYVTASNGSYEWRIASHTLMLGLGVEYQLVITARQGELDYRTVRAVSVVD